MVKSLIGALFGCVMLLGAANAASACYYRDGLTTDDGCYTFQAQVCSYSADGSGLLYYTGRVRIQRNSIFCA
jgi:hypothetical protein